MSRQDEYLAKRGDALREVARVSDPELKAVWQKIADGWANMARQAQALDDAAGRDD